MTVLAQDKWRTILSTSQWERLLLALVAANLFPLMLHALPFISAPDIGQHWLPIFYAPLIALLFCRGHVPLITVVAAPFTNHFLFGMPSASVLPGLTFELVVFCIGLLLVKSRVPLRGWHVLAVCFLMRAAAIFLFRSVGLEAFGRIFLSSLLTAAPGILLMAALTEVLARFGQERSV